MPYFFSSLPKARRSLPAMRAACVTLPPDWRSTLTT
jgi:hypothetical protein